MNCKFNFSAGPAILPKKVLLKAQSELLDWNGTGMSVMEMSHRGKEYAPILKKAELNLRKLLNDIYARNNMILSLLRLIVAEIYCNLLNIIYEYLNHFK